MKLIVTAIATCLLLFGVSATASWYLNQPEPNDELSTEVAETNPDSPADQPPIKKQVPTMEVAHRPDQSASLDAILMMSNEVTAREAKLKERELRVAKEEQRVKLLFADLQREQDELKALSDGIESKINVIDSMMTELNQVLENLDQRKIQLTKLEKQTGQQTSSKSELIQAQVDKTKSWFESIEPQQAADYLKGFANDGKLEYAARLLASQLIDAVTSDVTQDNQ